MIAENKDRIETTARFRQFKIISSLFPCKFMNTSELMVYDCRMSKENIFTRRRQRNIFSVIPVLIMGIIFFSLLSDLQAYSFPTLADAPGARPIALGEAFGAVSDDITAFHYNPASLSTLKNPQASIFYEKGLVNESYGNFSTGIRYKDYGVGAFLSYYDEGTLEFYDVTDVKKLHGRQELAYGLSVSQSFSRFSAGVTAKHLSSQLIEGVRGETWAYDLGMQTQFAGRNTAGVSLQNIGSDLKLSNASVPLPKNARLGFSFPLTFPRFQMLFLSDAIYDLNENVFIPAMGTEIPVGPLSLRAGFQNRQNQLEYSFGTGFVLSSFSIDYALLLASVVDAQHKVSMNWKFGASSSKGLESQNIDPQEESTK
jgi:hypothetical protein